MRDLRLGDGDRRAVDGDNVSLWAEESLGDFVEPNRLSRDTWELLIVDGGEEGGHWAGSSNSDADLAAAGGTGLAVSA